MGVRCFFAFILFVGFSNPVWSEPEISTIKKFDNAETTPPKPILELIEQTPPRFEILLNIPATQFTVYDRGVAVRHHRVSVGTPRWQTPVRKFHISEIHWNPWWLPPKSDWAEGKEKVPPGPGNPLYPVKLIMENAFRIHGTPSNWSIGRAASHGCMRMRRSEVRNLAEFFESRLVPDHDPEVFKKYRRKSWQPYYTKFKKADHIWVYMVYEPIERWANQIVLHPNYYGRRVNFEEELIDLMMDAGVYSAPIDLGKFHAIRKKYRRKRQTTIIPFQDLFNDEAVSKNLHPALEPICLAEDANKLEQARQRYNTRLRIKPTDVKPMESAQLGKIN